MDEYDVVVLGCGAAGMTAAIRAQAEGAEVGLFEKADRVTKGPQLSGALTIAETPLGRGAPGGIPPEELEKRKVRDERGTGQALAGRLLRGCLNRGIVPRTGARARTLVVEDGRIT